MSIDRKSYIGSSDAAGILGVSPWRTPLQVWQQKTGVADDEPPSPQKARVLARGQRLEGYVLEMLCDEMHVDIAHRNRRFVDEEHPFLACEIDAETATGENVEIKTVNDFARKDWGESGADQMPLYYAAQVQHGLMVTGRKMTIVAALIGIDDLRIYEVARDDETIAAIRKKEIAFWECVTHLLPPPPINSQDVLRLYSRDNGTAVEASTKAALSASRLVELKAEIKRLEAEQEDCETIIKMEMKDASTLLYCGAPIATWKAQKTNRFDATAFRAAHPELSSQYMSESSTRVLRIK